MSIGYFPQIYPDELLYSVIARYSDHCCYVKFAYAANEIFENPKLRVEREFMKNLSEDCIQILEKQKPLDKIIEKHTMMPYYARFYSMERKSQIISTMKNQNQDCSKLVGVPQNRTDKKRYLRVCPICVKNDRDKYGECYYHRMHQMWNLKICPEHDCCLVETDVLLDSSGTSVAVSAEQEWHRLLSLNKEISTPILSNNPIEMKYAQYNQDLFQLPLNIDFSRIADYICQRMIGTKYMSARGEHRYYSRLYEDMKNYYSDTTIFDNIKKMHIQQALMGKRLIFHEIVAILVFLNVSIDEIMNIKLTDLTPEQLFDQKVRTLKEQNLSRNEIARQLHVSSSVVDYAFRTSGGGEKHQSRNTISRGMDWEQKDKEFFPKVVDVVNHILSDSQNRPQNVSMYKVRRELGIPQHCVENMTNCRNYIQEHRLSQEELDCKAVNWAVDKIHDLNVPPKLWKICQIIKIGRERVVDVIKNHPELFNEREYQQLLSAISEQIKK